MKRKSKSYKSASKTMHAALSILTKKGGSMPIRDLMIEVECR